MLKKIVSIAVILAMICTVFAGCTADDVALYKALQKRPESSVTHTVASFDVTVEQPLSFGDTEAGFFYADPVNYLIQIVGGLLSITDLETTTTKSGNVSESKIKYSMPDASFSFNTWTQTDKNGQAEKVVMTLPSYVRPFLPLAISQKQYLSYDVSEYWTQYMQTMNTLYGADIIGGADGPTAIYTTGNVDPDVMIGMLTTALQDEKMIDQFAGILDINYVTNVERSGDNTIYTVKLNGPALKSIVKGIVSSLCKDELVEMISLMSGISAADFKAGLADADAYIDLICDFIINAGLLENGVNTKYTVNKDGYVIRTEENTEINVDIPRIADAAIRLVIQIMEPGISAEDMEEEIAETKAELQLAGKLKIAVKSVSDVTDIKVPNSVQMPELTDTNCIDIIKDITEYQAYETARMEWWYGSYDNSAERAYVMMHQPGNTITLRNNDTGAEVVTVPKTTAELYTTADENTYYYNRIYVPITDLAKLFDEIISVTWNDELMGVEVRYIYYGEEYVDLYLNQWGKELYFDSDSDDERYDIYDWVYESVDDWQFAADGRFYVMPSYFEYETEYDSRFEDNGYSYSKSFKFVYEGIDGNFFYEFEKMFQG